MNITINTSTAKSAKVSKKQSQDNGASVKKKKHKESPFAFKFTSNLKVKALVAKKRNPQLLTKKTNFRFKTSDIGNIVTDDPKKLKITTPSREKEESSEDNDIQLSLNVMAGSDKDRIHAAAKLKAKKLSKKEKKAYVIEKKAKAFKLLELSKNSQSIENANKESTSMKQLTTFSNSIAEENVNKASTSNTFAPNKNIKAKPKKMLNLFSHNPIVPIIGQKFVKPINEPLFTGVSMNTIGLHDHAVKNLADLLNITELTTVQQRTIPIVFSGRDVLVRSQTGSGKTLAYALPIVQKLQEIRPKISRDSGIHAIVIVPTRELAIQSYELFVKLLKPYTWIVAGYLSGGEKRKAEKARLRRGITIVVGTPGRICDHLMHTESFKLDNINWLVLDEADRLFDCGYEKDLKKIVHAVNQNYTQNQNQSKNPFDIKLSDTKTANDNISESKIQSLLLSATLTPSVQQLAGLALKNPMFIDTSDSTDEHIKQSTKDVSCETIVIPSTITQTYILVPPKLRLITLAGMIAIESIKPSKIIIFFATENLVSFHYDLLIETLTTKILDEDDDERIAEDEDEDDEDEPLLAGVRFFKLHGSLTQPERSGVFKAFINAKSGVLLTTDIAGRGIDVPMVDLVIQFSPSQKIQDYVHRVGRTARAGQTGRAVLFLSPNETDFIRLLEKMRIRISQDDADKYMQGIVRMQSKPMTMEESASELQRKFEELVAEDKEMYDKACKAFVSWARFIAAFPKNLRDIFNIKNTHMGHYAKSLGLRDPPKNFAKAYSTPKPEIPINRLTYIDRANEKKLNPKLKDIDRKRSLVKTGNLNKFLSKSVSLSTSEFGSGLPQTFKRKKPNI